MRKIIAMLLASIILVSTVISGISVTAADALPFTDVQSGKWYTDAVEAVYEEGIMTGKSSTVFDPSAMITRAEVVTAFARVACTSIVGYGDELAFTDTKTGKWYSDAVGWASDNGIVKGRGDGRFSPNDKITRAEIASILVNFIDYLEIEIPDGAKIDAFQDAGSFANWMKAPIEAVRKNGLMQGSDGKFNPNGNATRAEVAKVIANLLPYVGIVDVVKNGKSEYVIVVGENAAGAAERVQYQLEYTTGVKLEIVEKSNSKKQIVLGGSDINKNGLGKDGYEIRLDGENVIIDGETSDGIYRGAVRFMNAHTFDTAVKYTAIAAERVEYAPPVGKLMINGNDISKYTVYYPDNASNNTLEAVEDIVKYVEMASGVTLPKSTEKPGSFAVIVDETTVTIKDSVNNSLDNFTVKSEGNSIRLKGSADRGAAYACYDFLEKCVGCVFLTKNQDYIKPADEINIKNVDYTESPILAIRDNYNTASVPTLKFRDFAWSNANRIHSFATLAPDFCKQYDNQPCLLNEAVYDQVIENVIIKIKEKPDAHMVSVSMNDNSNWCNCEKCAPVIAEVGVTEYLIRFVNRVAEEIEKQGYTDILVHTFAYASTIAAPTTPPRENVLVQFAPIDSCLAHPLSDSCNIVLNYSNGKYLMEWGELGCKMFLWTYHGNYSNSPIPHTDISYRTMSTNAKLYVDCGIIGWSAYPYDDAEEICGDFSALRNYLLAKFMWNPLITEEEYTELVTTFMKGYYGDGWEKIYEAFNTYIEGDKDCHTLFHSTLGRIFAYSYHIDTEHLVDLFDEAELYAENETIWNNIDRNQLSFNMMEVFVKFDALYKSDKKEDYDLSQQMAKWYQDKMLTHGVSVGSEMYVSLEIGQFDVNPGLWREKLNSNYYKKVEDVTVDYPDHPTDLLPMKR